MPSVAAGLQAQRLDRAHHLDHLLDVAVLGRAPGRAHAEARGAGRLGALRGFAAPSSGVHQLGGLDAGVVVRRLRAVAAVLGAAAGLDRQQRGQLHVVAGRCSRCTVRARNISSVNGRSNSAATSSTDQTAGSVPAPAGDLWRAWKCSGCGVRWCPCSWDGSPTVVVME